MVSPNLIKKQESYSKNELTLDAKRLFQVIYREQNNSVEIDEDIPKIQVSALVSKLSFFYEKIRNAVDYEEEHLLRKNVINRILRRQVMIEGVIKTSDSVNLSKHLLLELIRGSYLPNNTIPEIKIKEIANLLEKYILLKDKVMVSIDKNINLKEDFSKVKDLIREKNQLTKWILSLAACEIEENLGVNRVKQTIINDMFSVLSKYIALSENSAYQKDFDIQIYLSVVKTYSKFDYEMLSFVLFKYYNKSWLEMSKKEVISKAEVDSVANHIYRVKELIEKQLKHPLSRQIDRVVKPYAVYFSILEGAIKNDPISLYNALQSDEKQFDMIIKKICNNKYKKAKSKLWRAAVRSIIYIFITKSLFVIAIEIPAIKLFGEQLNIISLAINISFPATLLFLIVLSTKLPKNNNTDKIIRGIKSIVMLGKEKKHKKILKPSLQRNKVLSTVFNIIYIGAFLASLRFIIWILEKIDFTWVSMIIFLFFLAFVSFFSILVTKGIKELIVVKTKENIFSFLRDLFYMPIIIAGRWLSRNFSRINIFIFIFDFIIEAPFQLLIQAGEDWTKYIKDKREKIEE